MRASAREFPDQADQHGDHPGAQLGDWPDFIPGQEIESLEHGKMTIELGVRS
jgi:hypothetical protein